MIEKISENFKQRWLFGLLSWVAVSLTFWQFLTIYGFNEKIVAVSVLAFVGITAVLRPPLFIRFLLYLLLYFFGVYHYFPLGNQFGLTWLQQLYQETRLIFAIGNSDGTDFPRLLAFAGIFLALILLMILMVEYQHFLLSYAVLLGYLLVVSLFNPLELTGQLLLIASCGWLAEAVKRQNSLRPHWRSLLLVLGLILVAGLAAWWLPNRWLRDPVVRVTTDVRNRVNQAGVYHYIENYNALGGSRTGFGEDDTNLGGSLVDDQTVVFSAVQKEAHYWRVDSKSIYTGKGWEELRERPQNRDSNQGVVFEDAAYQKDYAAEQTITLDLVGDRYLPLPYGRTAISPTNDRYLFQYFPDSRRVNFLQGSERKNSLKLIWQKPAYTVADLQRVANASLATDQPGLQVPEELPPRIKELAEEITTEATTMYDQVKAVENYLRNNIDFRYSKIDAVKPQAADDYVDQFLFESKVGYCDNFSSAMVVMLRTLGIPARWAKGFTEGDLQVAGDEKIWVVKNNHAHSWPEVYFQGYGWLPFEPTPSFQNPDQVQAPTNSEATPATASSDSSHQTDTTEESTETKSSSESNITSQTPAQKAFDWQKLVAPVLVAALAGALIGYWQFGLIWRVRLVEGFAKQPLAKGYRLLLSRLQQRLPRRQEEPLATYALRVEAAIPDLAGRFVQLTASYERMLYSKDKVTIEKGLLTEVARIIKRAKK